MANKRQALDNKGQTHRTLTRIYHAAYDPECSKRIHAAALQQIGVQNLTTQYLLQNGPTPLRVGPDTPVALFGLFQRWRVTTHTWLHDILQTVWRPAVEDAHASYEAWENTNAEHARLIVERTTPPEYDSQKKQKGIPRRVQHRRPDPKSLFVRRNERDREHQHVVRIAERVKVVDDRTLQLPGVGDVQLKEQLPNGMAVRAVTLVERTPQARGRRVAPEERTWNAHIQYREETPLKELPEKGILAAGIDHGIANALAVTLGDGDGVLLHYPEAKAESVREWNRAECQKARCKTGSRKYRKLVAKQRSIRRHETRRRHEACRSWANAIARSCHIIGIERLENRKMQLSARGTNEVPGANVAAKRGLNRRLRETAPGVQSRELQQAAERCGTRYRLVPATGTSITCSSCGHRSKENRKSQAVFLCTRCSRQVHADINAAENMRRNGLGFYRVGVDRSPGAPTPEKSLPGGVALTPETRRQDSESLTAGPSAETPRPG